MRPIRVILVTQGVSRVLAPLLASGHDVVGVLESMPRSYDEARRSSWIIGILKKLYFLLTRREIFLFDFCRRRNIPYNYLWKNNAEDVERWVKSLAPDLIVVYSMSQLLKESFLEIPRLGVINLHPSFLPSYRGPNPDFWQYHDMETHPGATVHYLDAGEDTGDILFQERIHVPLGAKSPARLDTLVGELGVRLLLKAVNAIAQGAAPRIAQPAQSPTARARNLRDDEHASIIEWDEWPIERVWNVLRGTESWLNSVPQPSGLWVGQRWSIDEYERTERPQGRVGNVGKYRGRKCIFAKDGVIYISIDYDIKRAIISFLKN